MKESIEMPSFCTEEHLEFLDQLREDGSTNMFGASPYLVAAFGVEKDEARAILSYWMRTFSQRHPKSN